MEKTLSLNNTYDIIVSVVETKHPKDSVHIKIQSRWSGAIDPNGLQKRFDITLTKERAIELCRLIEEASCA